MLHGFNFSKLVLLLTLIFTYSNAVILSLFITRVYTPGYSRCAAHTQTDSDVACSWSCDQGKI